MMLFRRGDRPPAEMRARFDRDERLASFADTVDGATVVATSHGLWWPDADGPRRIGWERVDKVVWRDGRLAVTEADVDDDTLLVERAPMIVTLSVPRDLPPVVRKRVEGNIVRSELVTVPDGAVRFVARRVPGRDGVRWWARLEPGTPDTPDVRSAVRARLERLRASP